MLLFAMQILNWNIPYFEYVLPLGIGMGVGVMFLLVATSWGRKPPPPPPLNKIHQEYDPFVHGSPSDQRKSFRRGGNLVEIYYAPPEQKNNPQAGWVFDRSVGGLGLVVAEEQTIAMLLAVRPVNAPPMIPWVDVEVRSCRPVADGFELGCQFIKTPPWNILLMFG